MPASQTLDLQDAPNDEVSEAGDSEDQPTHGHGDHPMVSDENAEKPSTSGAYSCPMHPDVSADEPGTCPKCGMPLVKANE